MKKSNFQTKKIECTTPIPFDQAWSREFKNVLLFVSIASYMMRKMKQHPPRIGTPTEPMTPEQDDDPERIDDVV